MQYQNVAKGINCQRRQDELNNLKRRAKSQGDHVSRLVSRAGAESRLHENLLSQAERTGDHEGFASDIRRAKENITNLKHQIQATKRKAQELRDLARKLARQMAQDGCSGFA